MFKLTLHGRALLNIFICNVQCITLENEKSHNMDFHRFDHRNLKLTLLGVVILYTNSITEKKKNWTQKLTKWDEW